jgi:alpha-mannosidase
MHREFTIANPAVGGEHVQLAIEVACNGLFGLANSESLEQIGILRQAEIAIFDAEAWALYWDFMLIQEMAEHLPVNTPRAGQALFVANAMVNLIDPEQRSTWPAARQLAAHFLAAHNGDSQHRITAVGHAHIDTAWLWPLAETKRKCVRSFATAINYMANYPDYLFVCSQAQQYAWIKENTPDLYNRIRERVRSGQFIPVGGTWVEPDCNIPSGESLVRQFLYGQRFFQQEFGIHCQEFWNPDVFGYSGALPQIIRGAGMRYFLTQKLSWNQFNKPASHSFWWEGIDGSRVLTHFPPADTYNANMSVKEVLYNVSNFKDHERSNESMMLYGIGDGGGGPTLEMIERAQRMKDVDGLPLIRFEAPSAFFDRLAAGAHEFTTWVGELYFELHRGTYTTQARNKRGNRACEWLLHDVEFLSAAAWALHGASYPGAEIERLWKLVLLNQFHDIIPGSSINEVYVDSARDYAYINEQGTALRTTAFEVFDPAQRGASVVVINTLGRNRRELVELPEGMEGGQVNAAGRSLAVVQAPALGFAVQTPQNTVADAVRVEESETIFTLENQQVRAVLGRDGRLISLIHKDSGRESLAAGEYGNRFMLYDDRPNDWDAWDIDIFHLETGKEDGAVKSARLLEAGPLRGAVEFEYAVGAHSWCRQVVSLSVLSSRLDFDNQVEWHEKHRFLKVEFPLNVRAPNAAYEIQFGHVQRPTHYNTSWDVARFEVCAHKWADLSESGFGVALLNDCKYGYAAQGHVLRLSLLRAPTLPDPYADEGKHQFRYALLPHTGTLQEAGVIEEAYRFNAPLLLAASNGAAHEQSLLAVDAPSVVIDTVKKAEDENALIVRMYEAFGGRCRLRLSSPLPVKRASRVNLLEQEESEAAWQAGGVNLDIKPFEIITLKLDL